MKGRHCFYLLAALIAGCAPSTPNPPELLGQFELGSDLYLAHFDSKTDVDDIHSIAGVATLLADSRFAEVSFHAVAGAYGIQEGLYVPANELFDLAFGERWSDAHADFDLALEEVTAIAVSTLDNGGKIWIAEAGQSDFSAALVDAVGRRTSADAVKNRVHIVQHSDWNESVTTPERLTFVKEAASYHKIPDGNAVGNGTPGFRSDSPVDWRSAVTNSRLLDIWAMATEIADRYNGVENRYLNASIAAGGLDFSDVAESAWIFGFEDLQDAPAFFAEFDQR